MRFRKQLIFVIILLLNFTPLAAQKEISPKEIVSYFKQGVEGVKNLLKIISIYKVFDEEKTLLHYAVEEGNYHIVSFLVRHDIFLSEKGGEFYATALQDAIYYGHTRIALFLIEEGTLLNEQDIEGDTALHLAVRNGDLSVVKTLLAYGANQFILNNNGDSPSSLISDLMFEDHQEINKLFSINENFPRVDKNLQLNTKALEFTDNSLEFDDKDLSFTTRSLTFGDRSLNFD